MKILVTGGAGFIGSNLLEKLLKDGHTVAIMDNFTYAADMNFVQSLNNVAIFKGDIADQEFVMRSFSIFHPDGVIHLAAESHVDNSITNPGIFVKTNVMGTQSLLDAFLYYCHIKPGGGRFHHISTDEVFGHLELGEKPFDEKTPYNPRSPYAASKAASDMLVRAYINTYKIDAVITNCSNNFGIRQHDEKLIPTVIRNLVNRKTIPVYGKGENIRDWLFVEDHVDAICKVFFQGTSGETYCVGGKKEMPNIEMIKKICGFYDSLMDQDLKSFETLVDFVKDRLGHDFRYSVDPKKIENELGWSPKYVPIDFDHNLYETVKWYVHKYTEKD